MRKASDAKDMRVSKDIFDYSDNRDIGENERWAEGEIVKEKGEQKHAKKKNKEKQ